MSDNDPKDAEDAPEDVVVIDVTPDEDDKPADPAPKKRRRAPLLIAALILILAVLAGGVYFAPQIRTYIPGLEETPKADAPAPAPADNRLSDELTRQMAALDRRLTALENRPVPQAGDVDLSPLEDQLRNTARGMQDLRSLMEDMSRRIALLEERPVASDTPGVDPQVVDRLRAEVSSLRNQLAALEFAPKDSPEVIEPLTVVALARLRQAVELGQSYAPALKGVEQLLVARGTVSASAGRALQTLETSADEGISTFPALSDAFTDIASDIVAKENMPEDPSWWDRTVSTVSGAVTVRSTGNLEGNSTEARVARAEVALEASDLATAVGEIDGITGGGKNVARIWLEAAKKRLAALAALDTLEAELLEGL